MVTLFVLESFLRGGVMEWMIFGVILFGAINLGLTLAFRHWDLHWWIDEMTDKCKDLLNKIRGVK